MAEQTLTINTLAATVITPSDVSQFSLDDIAPNIINGGGGTIVDVSGIVALASQVAELDSDVTVLEANVATVQANVVDLQNAVGGLDTAVVQAQTTATAAAETATAASGAASDAKAAATQAQTTASSAAATADVASGDAYEARRAAIAAQTIANSAKEAATAASETAQYALKSGTATELQYEDPYGNTSVLKAKLDAGYHLHLEGEDGRRLSLEAASATTLNYATSAGITGYLEASVSDGQITFRDQNDKVLSVAGGSSSGGGFDGSYSGSTLNLEGTDTVKISSTSSMITLDSYAPNVGPAGSVNGVMTAVAYSEMWLLSGGGDDSSGRVVVGARGEDGTLSAMIELSTGSEWSPNYAARVFIGSGMDAMSGNNSYRHGIAVTTNGSESTFQVYTDKIGFGTQDDPVEIYINGAYWDPTSGGSSSGGAVASAQYALQAGTAAYALSVASGSGGSGVATSLAYTDNTGNTGQLQAYFSHNTGGLAFHGDNGSLIMSEVLALVAPRRDGSDLVGFRVSDDYSYEGTQYTAMCPLNGSTDPNVLIAATAAYALAGEGGFVDGRHTEGGLLELLSGTEALLNVSSGASLRLTKYDAVLTGAHVNVAGDATTRIGASSGTITFVGTTTFNTGATDIMIDGAGSPTSLKDTILQYAGSGDSSASGYPPLTQQPTSSNLYYGIVRDNSSLRFGSFGAADGSQAEAVVKVYDDDIYVTSRGGYSNSKQTYGLAVTPPAIRVGTWAGDSPSMYKGMCIPNGVDPAGFMSVGSFIDGTCSYVWGLMADSTTAAFGKVKRSPASGSSINLEEGLQVSEQYVLLANNYNVSGQKSSLEMDADGTTLSAVFTLRSGETTITPSDWAKLKQLADKADELLALLNS